MNRPQPVSAPVSLLLSLWPCRFQRMPTLCLPTASTQHPQSKPFGMSLSRMQPLALLRRTHTTESALCS